jgi:hypothetical protein
MRLGQGRLVYFGCGARSLSLLVRACGLQLLAFAWALQGDSSVVFVAESVCRLAPMDTIDVMLRLPFCIRHVEKFDRFPIVVVCSQPR